MEKHSLGLFDPSHADRRFKTLVNLAYVSTIALIGVFAMLAIFRWMMPFVVAFVVAVMLQRPIRWMVKRTFINRKLSSVILVIAVVLTIAGVAAVVIWQAFAALYSFANDQRNISMITNTLSAAAENIIAAIDQMSDSMPAEVIQTMKDAVSNLSSTYGKLAESLGSFILNTAASLPNFLINFIFWIVASIFITIDYDNVMSFLFRQVPERHRELLTETKSLFHNTIFKLLRTYAVLMLLTFIELSIGFMLLGISSPILVAGLISLVDILPVLGTGTIVIPWALIAAFTGNYRIAVGLGIVYLIVTIVRNFLEPRLVSRQIGLTPLVTLFFMFLGLQVAGLFGVLTFPLAVMIMTQLQQQGHLRIWK